MNDILDRRMTCTICLERVGKDACQFLCPGQHAICFSCVLQYCESLGTSYQQLQCPTCKTGDGSFFFSSFMAELSEQEQSPNDWMSRFNASYDVLHTEYPSIFNRNNKQSVIEPIQLILFIRYCQRSVQVTERQRTPPSIQSLPSGQPLQWISIMMNTVEEMYALSFHQNEFNATRSVLYARPRYNVCFIIEARGRTLDTCVVTHQERPVHITVLLPFEWYVDNTFQLSTTFSDEIKHTITQSL